jgi:hypothetical protein
MITVLSMPNDRAKAEAIVDAMVSPSNSKVKSLLSNAFA